MERQHGLQIFQLLGKGIGWACDLPYTHPKVEFLTRDTTPEMDQVIEAMKAGAGG